MNLFVVRTWLEARCTASERGASTLEYVLILGLIAILLIAAVTYFGGLLKADFGDAGSQLSSANA